MRTLFITAFVFGSLAAFSQQTLDDYVQEGLTNNLVLQQKHTAFAKAMLGLKIANGLFAPTVGLQGNYTSGDGGRSIAIPVGDMLNPVYATLNQLTESNQFPQIENVSENFFPKNFYDVKVRTSLPIINTNLYYNRKISEQQALMQEYEVDIYKRELVKNIKVAYFNYLSAIEAISIYESAMTRALENKRVNESLLKNGKGLHAYVLRSESEIEHIRYQLTDAKKQAEDAQMYFNFLLNRERSAAINTVQVNTDQLKDVNALLGEESNFQQREEFKQLRQSAQLTENVLKMNKLYWAPKVGGFVDLGSQNQDWQFNNNSRYYLIGLQVDVPLFAGFTNRFKVSQSRLDMHASELSMKMVGQQLDMNTAMARSAVRTSYEGYVSANKQLEAAQSYLRLIEKGYQEGINSFIEAIDARNQLTAAQLQVTIKEYQTLIALANLERENASYSFN